jgi:NAD(P)H dehydrogenase (quinone)
MIVVTGATGQLGQLVIEDLLKTVPAEQIVAAVRSPQKATAFTQKGIQVREADYARPETLATAFAGASKVLLISSNDLDNRVQQHKAVIDAAKTAGVKLLAYTGILHSETSTLILAETHKATEDYLRASGVPFVMLRNGWYFENHTAALAPALEHGAIIGSSKNGRFAAAARADYAAAAAVVLATEGHAGKAYELAGDASYTRAELAAEVSKLSGKPVVYQDLPEAEYAKILSSFLPPSLAHILADADAKAANGELDDTSHTLSTLIGRPTASLTDAVRAALKA